MGRREADFKLVRVKDDILIILNNWNLEMSESCLPITLNPFDFQRELCSKETLVKLRIKLALH